MDQEEILHSAAVVPAAGRGIRMGTSTRKQFLNLGGEPVLVHTLRVLQGCSGIDSIILVVPEEDRTFCEDKIVEPYAFDKVAAIIPGGKERQDSVFAGLQAVGSAPHVVLIHDGVRPFLTENMVRETIRQAAQGVSAVAGVPVSDTVKSVDSKHRVIATLSREDLWSIQTPQAFPYTELLKAYEKAYQDGVHATDDAALIERMGLPVRVLMGSYENIKITSPADLILGEAILKQRLGHANRTRL